MDDITFDKLSRLGQLRSSGVLTDQEFEARKTELLQAQVPADQRPGTWSVIKRRQKLPWVLLCCLLLWPVGLYLMWTRPIYQKHKDGPREVGTGAKLLLTVVYMTFAVYWILRTR